MSNVPTGIVIQIAVNLIWFGVRLSRQQACSLAEIYLTRRPHFCARDVAESMARMPTLLWPWVDITRGECILMMGILVDGLDQQYWVDTFEHECETVCPRLGAPEWIREAVLVVVLGLTPRPGRLARVLAFLRPLAR